MLKFPKLKRTSRGHEESDLQQACERLLECLGLTYLRLPDPVLGYLSKPSTPAPIRALVGKYFKGQPDLIILDRGRYLLVELKSQDGKVRDSQNAWAKGHELHIVRDITTFKNLVTQWIEANER